MQKRWISFLPGLHETKVKSSSMIFLLVENNFCCLSPEFTFYLKKKKNILNLKIRSLCKGVSSHSRQNGLQNCLGRQQLHQKCNCLQNLAMCVLDDSLHKCFVIHVLGDNLCLVVIGWHAGHYSKAVKRVVIVEGRTKAERSRHLSRE